MDFGRRPVEYEGLISERLEELSLQGHSNKLICLMYPPAVYRVV